MTRSILQSARRIVVKVGSSLVTNEGSGLDRQVLGGWAGQISRLKKMGKEVVLVSSGAVAEGMQRLGWKTRPAALYELQAAAAVGQMDLAQAYADCFSEYKLLTAQILLTHDDLSSRKRYLNARSTILTLLNLDIVPIINENDTVVSDEIRFGDNDNLAALVANLIEAEVLVILTDQEGLFTGDPRKHADATLISEISVSDPHIETMAGGTSSGIGRGGMQSKVMAARRAARSGAHTVIASGRVENVLVRLANGEAIGTSLLADMPVKVARKLWLADHLQVRGSVVLDDGASRALLSGGKSLLPIGVVEVRGNFERGEAISCLNTSGREIARGLANYSARESHKIMRRPSSQIEAVLGYVGEYELVHRDNLVIL
ncbi:MULTISPECIES: glutamate 5-kinase [Nitrosomonas]|uniref:glutamate 5-kinase n=1 Tax=Nitrosomonas TaxID=914 RepID=UPI0008869DE5|nr:MULTISPECIES: glutamate 5-kinase [Nitrosomonas]MXS79273.1 glutamate 5-kinase [Nitrosomonas sp. GH22]SCX18454.1 glutamate 5-kinase [Nitrosomonas eutropha]SDW63462.1 glutamate 5-kinase [Nitrosomonas eutropha]SEI61837.1 glutamate 5-kinase [Nitrosomonas eutropha]